MSFIVFAALVTFVCGVGLPLISPFRRSLSTVGVCMGSIFLIGGAVVFAVSLMLGAGHQTWGVTAFCHLAAVALILSASAGVVLTADVRSERPLGRELA
jgi:hypothetical protein